MNGCTTIHIGHVGTLIVQTGRETPQEALHQFLGRVGQVGRNPVATTRNLGAKRATFCPDCGGVGGYDANATGEVGGSAWVECPTCGGSGGARR